MSLTLACELAADLSDLDLVRLREFVRRSLDARGFHEPVRPLSRRDLDELEPRVTHSQRADTLPAPPPPHNPEDDGG